MNVKSATRTANVATSADDILVTTVIPHRRLIASTVAALMTATLLAVVGMPIHAPAADSLHGLHVTTLSAVTVAPTAAELRAAALLENVAVGTVTVPGAAAARLGADLAMPYYSFGVSNAKASSKE